MDPDQKAIKRCIKNKDVSENCEEVAMDKCFPQLTPLDISNQHILKSDINGLGFSFILDSETFSSICDIINIENSLKSLVAFGKIKFDIRVGEENGYFYMNAHLIMEEHNKSKDIAKSPLFKSKKQNFLKAKINKWILKSYFCQQKNRIVSLMFADNEEFFITYMKIVDQLSKLMEEKTQLVNPIEMNEDQIPNMLNEKDKEISHLKNFESKLKMENEANIIKIKALEKELTKLKDEGNSLLHDNKVDENEMEMQIENSDPVEEVLKSEREKEVSNVKLISESNADLKKHYEEEIQRLKLEYNKLKGVYDNLTNAFEQGKLDIAELKKKLKEANEQKNKMEESLTKERERIDKVVDDLCKKTVELKEIWRKFYNEKGKIKNVSQQQAIKNLDNFKKHSKESNCFLWIEDDQPIYEVKKILGRRVNEEKQLQYSILWKDKQVSWEPAENICPELIQEFNQSKGIKE